jgi:hypothetical protein
MGEHSQKRSWKNQLTLMEDGYVKSFCERFACFKLSQVVHKRRL